VRQERESEAREMEEMEEREGERKTEIESELLSKFHSTQPQFRLPKPSIPKK